MEKCKKCNIGLQQYWLKNGICNGCQNPQLIVESIPDPEALYLDYFNNFLTILRFAEWYGMSESQAMAIISEGRKINHERKK